MFSRYKRRMISKHNLWAHLSKHISTDTFKLGTVSLVNFHISTGIFRKMANYNNLLYYVRKCVYLIGSQRLLFKRVSLGTKLSSEAIYKYIYIVYFIHNWSPGIHFIDHYTDINARYIALFTLNSTFITINQNESVVLFNMTRRMLIPMHY